MTERLNEDEKIRALAEGRIKCYCGNREWRQFLYLNGSKDHYLAGCKLCGTIYRWMDSPPVWEEIQRGTGVPHGE